MEKAKVDCLGMTEIRIKVKKISNDCSGADKRRQYEVHEERKCWRHERIGQYTIKMPYGPIEGVKKKEDNMFLLMNNNNNNGRLKGKAWK